MSFRHRLEEAMEECYPDGIVHLDLDAGFRLVLSGELACECGDRPFVTAEPGEPLTCPTCGASYGVATRLTLVPLAQ